MTSSQYAKAMELWGKGVSIKRIAYEIGMSKEAVAFCVHYHREDFPARLKRLTQEQRERIIALRNRGVTYKDVAKQVGCCRNTAMEVVRKHRMEEAIGRARDARRRELGIEVDA